MRRSRLVVLIPLAAACAAGNGCSSEAPDTSANLAEQLEQDTGVTWLTHTTEDQREVRFLAPEKPVRIGEGTPEQMARAFSTGIDAISTGPARPTSFA